MSGDFSDIAALSKSQVPVVLHALSALSKFLGCYDRFRVLVKKYGLSWVGRSPDDLIIDRLNRSDDPEDVWNWIRDVKECFPEISNFMDLISTTGLRFSEAFNCYNLIIKLTRDGSLTQKYYNVKTGFLEHFKFKEIFIRSSKKAYVSFVPLDLLESIGQGTPFDNKNRIHKHFQRRHMTQRFGDVREAHGSFMVKHLKEVEIDVLQGRVTGTVFKIHYLNVKTIGDLKSRAAKGAAEILAKIQVCEVPVTQRVVEDIEEEGEGPR